MLDEAFEGHQSKGLFTFYREQSEMEMKIHRQKVDSTQVEDKYHSKTERYEKEPAREGQRVLKSSAHAHSSQMIQPSSVRNYRYDQQKAEESDANLNVPTHKKKPSNQTQETIKNVVSLNFNYQSTRKNNQQDKIMISKSKRSKTLVESNGHIVIKSPRHNNSITSLHIEISSNEMFRPKRDMYMYSCKKNPLKMNSIVGRCLEGKEVFKNKKMKRDKLQTINTLREDDQKFYMPLIVAPQRKEKERDSSSNTLFRDKLDERRKKILQCTFWEEMRSRKKTNIAQRARIININKKIEEWMDSQKSIDHQATIIHQTPIPNIFLSQNSKSKHKI